ncbi:MAG: GDSL-type esterase/lipase family protein [Planctomycetota bacterium]|jgi:beta-glucosidase
MRYHIFLTYIAAALTLTGCAPNDGVGFEVTLTEGNTAVQPVPRADFVWRNRDNLGWMERHDNVVAQSAMGKARLIFIGDSITHGWDAAGADVWAERYTKYDAINMGFGGDKTEHVLWRLANGAVDGIQPKVAVLMIGTNNSRANTGEEIGEALIAICGDLRVRLPDTKILVLAIFPRNTPDDERRATNNRANEIVSQITDNRRVHYLDIGHVFVDENGNIPKDIMGDALHPSTRGYSLWADAMQDKLDELMGEKAQQPANLGASDKYFD